MLPIAEAVTLTELSALIEQIHLRKVLRHQMVGTLYPNIVVDEVSQLVQRYEELGGTTLSTDLYERSKR